MVISQSKLFSNDAGYSKRSEVSFRSNSLKRNLKSHNTGEYVTFSGNSVHKKDIDKYNDTFNKYLNTTELHNRILYSFGDPSSMAQVFADECKRTGKTKDEIFIDVRDKLVDLFNNLKSSKIIVVEGTNLVHTKLLNKDRYNQIKNIYMDLFKRSELFNTVKYNGNTKKLDPASSEEDIEKLSADAKHIISDILPRILQEKTLVVGDITNLHKILSDEVIQSLVLEKLELEDNKDKLGKHLPVQEEYEITPEDKRLQNALKLLEKVNEKYNITVISKVASTFYNPFGKHKKAPDNYYNDQMFGLRSEPKNFYEAQFLNAVSKKIKGYNPANTILVTPKFASDDMVEKLKAMNKDYLFIEEWLYKYALGDNATRQKVLEDLNSAGNGQSQEELKALAKDLDNYLDTFFSVYDIKNPANNAKLHEAVQEFSRISAMSELSRDYFLEVGRDAKRLIRLLVGVGALSQMTKMISKSIDGATIAVLGETLVSKSEDISDACQNYLKWKKEFGEEEAQKMFINTVSHILTLGVPTLGLDLIPYGSVTKNLLLKPASTTSFYVDVINTYKRYHSKLNDLIDKGLKKIPDDIKDNPQEIEKWKVTETWKAFSAHSFNRGEAAAIAMGLPMAVISTILFATASSFGVGALFALFDQTFESCIPSIFLLLDSSRWNKFNDNLKKSFVDKKKAGITPEQYLEMRKNAGTKFFESEFGKKSLEATLTAADKCPSKLKQGVKKAYMSLFNIVSNTAGKVISTICLKRLDKKYAQLQKEEELLIKQKTKNVNT